MLKLNIGEKVNTFHLLMIIAAQFVGAVAWATTIHVNVKESVADIKVLKGKTDEISVIKNDIIHIRESQLEQKEFLKDMQRSMNRIENRLYYKTVLKNGGTE